MLGKRKKFRLEYRAEYIEIDKHFVTIIMTADYYFGKIILKEPEKCEQWAWFDWANLPESISSPLVNLVKQKFSPF